MRCDYDSLFSFKYSPRPNTAALELDGQVPEEEKGRRLTILQEQQRAHSDPAERGTGGLGPGGDGRGIQQATGQWIGRTSQNRILNFIQLAGRERAARRELSARARDAGRAELVGGRERESGVMVRRGTSWKSR